MERLDGSWEAGRRCRGTERAFSVLSTPCLPCPVRHVCHAAVHCPVLPPAQTPTPFAQPAMQNAMSVPCLSCRLSRSTSVPHAHVLSVHAPTSAKRRVRPKRPLSKTRRRHKSPFIHLSLCLPPTTRHAKPKPVQRPPPKTKPSKPVRPVLSCPYKKDKTNE